MTASKVCLFSRIAAEIAEGHNVDRSTVGGLGLAVAGICVGLYLDDGKLGQLLQPTAAMIVFGGRLAP
jgi:hypothetical protein